MGNGITEEPIQGILVGERVATDGGVANSSDGEAAASPNATTVNPKTSRVITITANDWEVQTLEPLSWIKAHSLRAGGRVHLSNFVNLDEMGVPAGLVGTVDAIGPCPAIQPGSGRVVLTTVNHLNDDVYELTMKNTAGVTETLGVTGYHRFYDQTIGWVQVQNLYLGEPLRGAYGTLTVTGLVRHAGNYRVYNMTVEADHVYYVGDLPALVHNTCLPGTPEWEDAWSLRRLAISLQTQSEASLTVALQLTIDAAEFEDPVLLEAYGDQIALWLQDAQELQANANTIMQLFNSLVG